MNQFFLFSCTTISLLLIITTSTTHRTPISVERTIDDPHNHRHLLSYNEDPLAAEPWLEFENPRLKNAYIALQAWKEAILSDPNNITADWVGPDPCAYTGVICWPAPDNPCERTVAGIDVNHADIAGHLPHELGLLYDLAVFHLNSNRFCGTIPQSLTNLYRLHELDLSNNRFAGKFPELFLNFQNLKYLDIRYNEFEGGLPYKLFDKHFDAIFVNDNRFSSALPENIGNSPVSVIVMANNMFEGCVPASLGNMSATLNELIITNNGLSSCFPSELGKLRNLTVLDVSRNKIVGGLPDSIGDLNSLEQLNVGYNMMSGKIPTGICRLPNLASFLYNDNFFTEEAPDCSKLPRLDDRMNCFRGRPDQKTDVQCRRFLSRAVNCSSFDCGNSYKPPAPICPPPQLSPNPINGSPSPPVTFSPPPAKSTPPMCQCVKPPPQPANPPPTV
ncbi:Leucine-rich repeat extensin-like protein 7 [Orobanche hederae]